MILVILIALLIVFILIGSDHWLLWLTISISFLVVLIIIRVLILICQFKTRSRGGGGDPIKTGGPPV